MAGASRPGSLNTSWGLAKPARSCQKITVPESLQQGLQTAAIQFVPFIMAVVFHEYAHGLIAARWGDTTARDQGRLTLNPVPHIDPIGTIAFPLINMVAGIPLLFGWAKPVPIDPRRFRKYRPGLFWVSFAGPLMNFILALVSAVIAYLVLFFVPKDFYLHEPLKIMAVASVSLNYALGIFNLIPLPPLDGSKMVSSFLSYNASRKYEALGAYSFFILIALMITGLIRVISGPIQFMTELTFAGVETFFGAFGL
jgi:Zn-dependent protease